MTLGISIRSNTPSPDFLDALDTYTNAFSPLTRPFSSLDDLYSPHTLKTALNTVRVHSYPFTDFQGQVTFVDSVLFEDSHNSILNTFGRSFITRDIKKFSGKNQPFPETLRFLISDDYIHFTKIVQRFKTIFDQQEMHTTRSKHHDIDSLLMKMLSLKDGWLDGSGLAPSIEGVVWLSATFESYYHNMAPSPYVYPTEEGNIQVEWSLGAREITLEINLKTHMGFWHELNLDTEHEEHRVLDVNLAEVWDWIMDRIEVK